VGAAYKELTGSTGWGANLGTFTRWIATHPAAYLAAQITADDESKRLKDMIEQAQDWLDEMEQRLP
jgi:hypothetical protein